MPNPPRDKERIFQNTSEMLDMARSGYADAIGPDPRARRRGLMNLFTYGRSVTLTIQTMKHTDAGFETWWKPYKDQLAADPLMHFFNDRRNKIVHQGELATTNSTVIGADGPVDMGPLMQALQRYAPPNTEGIFLGDQLGGDGWEVRMPDGSLETVYFQLPEGLDVKSSLDLLDPPHEHDGHPITDLSVANLGRLYIAALTKIVDEFVARFRPHQT